MTEVAMEGIEKVKDLVGTELGVGDWVEVTQDKINLFADATGDHQWIHVDPERAKAGPFGAPIAHGYLTLSLIPSLGGGGLRSRGPRWRQLRTRRVRFPAPVPAGSRVRARRKLLDVSEGRGVRPAQGRGDDRDRGEEPSGVRGGDAEPGVLLSGPNSSGRVLV